MAIFKSPIRKRVMSVVEEKIVDAEIAHDVEVAQLEKQLDDEIESAHRRHRAAREEVVDRLVGQIVRQVV